MLKCPDKNAKIFLKIQYSIREEIKVKNVQGRPITAGFVGDIVKRQKPQAVEALLEGGVSEIIKVEAFKKKKVKIELDTEVAITEQPLLADTFNA